LTILVHLKEKILSLIDRISQKKLSILPQDILVAKLFHELLKNKISLKNIKKYSAFIKNNQPIYWYNWNTTSYHKPDQLHSNFFKTKHILSPLHILSNKEENENNTQVLCFLLNAFPELSLSKDQDNFTPFSSFIVKQKILFAQTLLKNINYTLTNDDLRYLLTQIIVEDLNIQYNKNTNITENKKNLNGIVTLITEYLVKNNIGLDELNSSDILLNQSYIHPYSMLIGMMNIPQGTFFHIIENFCSTLTIQDIISSYEIKFLAKKTIKPLNKQHILSL